MVKQHRLKGSLLGAFSFGIVGLAIAIFAGLVFLFYRVSTQCGFELNLNFFVQSGQIIVPLFLALVVSAIMPIYKRAKRHLVPLADSTLKSDVRRPIVFLRSFSQESQISSEEENIRDALKSFGPFVALGSPKDELPPLGASRLYVGDEWEDRVRSLLGDASLVVILAGSTPAIAWEMLQVRALVDPSRVLIAVPNNEEVYNEFRSTVENSTDIVLPEYPHQETERGLRISGLVRLDKTWAGAFQAIPKKYAWTARRAFDENTREIFIILDVVRDSGKVRDVGFTLDVAGYAIVTILVMVITVGGIATSCYGPAIPASPGNSMGDGLRSR
jgi:hypothetical protein